MTNHSKIRVGVVGVGGIAQNQHIPGFLRCDNVEIAAICDVNEALLTDVGERYQVPFLTTDYQKLLELDELDVIDICTANDAHYPIAMAAIERGKHVFCEKPLALSYRDARQMHDAALQAGVKTGVGFVHRVTPAARLANQIIREGSLGEIYQVTAVFSAGSADFAERPMSWRHSKAQAGAGALVDMGAHMIDMVCWWLGQDITAVCAQIRTFVEQRFWPGSNEAAQVDTEDASAFLANFEGGAMGTFINSYVFSGRGYDQRVEVYGSNGGIIYDQALPTSLQVCIGKEMLQLSAASGVGGRKVQPYPLIPVPEALKDRWSPDRAPSRTLTPDFISGIRGENSFLPTFYEGMRVQEVLEAALRSAQEERWIRLPLAVDAD